MHYAEIVALLIFQVVGKLQSGTCLLYHSHCDISSYRIERLVSLENRVDWNASEKLHANEELLFLNSQFKDLAHIRMRNACCNACLRDEHVDDTLLFGVLWQQ